MEPRGTALPARRVDDVQTTAGALRFGEALRLGDAKLAENVAESLIASGSSAATVHARVIAPAMWSIGDLWERGRISVADEHLATAISHNVLARLFPHLLQTTMLKRERVMLAATHGEHHVLGLRMVGDILEGAGFDVIYLGPDLPLESLLEACRKHQPAVLGLTASMPLNVPTLLDELVEVSQLADPPLLMVGGRALPPAVAAGLKVPVVVSADQAVSVVEGLLAQGSQGPPLDETLLQRIPRGRGAIAGEADVGSVADHFSETALASADTARDSARRAAAMEQLALRDSLTGMWNRRAYDDRLAELADEGAAMTVLMVDVDHFKSVNDTYGHDVGDATLCRVARSIVQNIRPSDFAARYGGDEFIVLLPGATTADAVVVAERVRTGVSDGAAEPPLTVSIGLAGFSGEKRLTGLAVDQALYKAKAAGRNQVAVVES